jgi:hypothetical protein
MIRGFVIPAFVSYLTPRRWRMLESALPETHL